MVTREDVLRQLATLADPDGGDVTDRVRSLVVTDGRVGLALGTRRTGRAAMEGLRSDVEATLGRLEGVTQVLAAVVEDDDEPVEPTGLGARAMRLAGRLVGDRGSPRPPAPAATADRPGAETRPTPRQNAPAVPPGTVAGAPRAANALPGVQRIVAVGSGKGGVGKSTVAVNLAVAFAAMGWRVGLVDADIFGPSVPILIGARDYRPTGRQLAPVVAHGIAAMSIGFLVEPEKAVVWRGPMVTGALMQLVRETVWGELDILFIDMPPGTGDVQLSLAQQLPLDGAVVVTTPQDLALADVRKAIGMFDAVRVPVLGIVENMATFVCPCCGTETAIFGEGGGEREATARGVPFLGRLPLAADVREASDAGIPPAADPTSPASGAYASIAANLAAAIDRTAAKSFPTIVFDDG